LQITVHQAIRPDDFVFTYEEHWTGSVRLYYAHKIERHASMSRSVGPGLVRFNSPPSPNQTGSFPPNCVTRLRLEPSLASSPYVFALLLSCVRRPFFQLMP
jgi:hypothetical protein